METERLPLEAIEIGERHRAVDAERVAALASSMQAIGLQTPISVWVSDDQAECTLVAGRHRLEAARSLGWDEIECIVVDMDATDRELWEIDENLMRAELSVSQQAQHLARRKELWDGRNSGKSSPTIRKRGMPKGFAADTSGQTGVSKRTINQQLERAHAIAPDVLNQIGGTALDTGVYMDALKKLTPEQQRQRVAGDLSAHKKSTQAAREIIQPPSAAINDFEAVNKQVGALVSAWNKAGPEARKQFIEEYIDVPLMNARYGDAA